MSIRIRNYFVHTIRGYHNNNEERETSCGSRNKISGMSMKERSRRGGAGVAIEAAVVLEKEIEERGLSLCLPVMFSFPSHLLK